MMTPRDFCYWLRGFMELSEVGGIEYFEDSQYEMIKEHLDKVFVNYEPINTTPLQDVKPYIPFTSNVASC